MGITDFWKSSDTVPSQVNAPPQAGEVDEQGNPKKEGMFSSWMGGRRGSFAPNDAHSSASDAAPFTGGRRRRTRRTNRGSRKRTRRHRR